MGPSLYCFSQQQQQSLDDIPVLVGKLQLKRFADDGTIRVSDGSITLPAGKPGDCVCGIGNLYRNTDFEIAVVVDDNLYLLGGWKLFREHIDPTLDSSLYNAGLGTPSTFPFHYFVVTHVEQRYLIRSSK